GRDVIRGRALVTDRDGSLIGDQRAGEHVHQRRLAGTVVPDQPDAFPGANREVHTTQGADGAKTLSDPVHADDHAAMFSHGASLVADLHTLHVAPFTFAVPEQVNVPAASEVNYP